MKLFVLMLVTIMTSLALEGRSPTVREGSPPTLATAQDYDLLITNGRIVDGSGRAAYNADLGISGDRIVRIGKLGRARAKRTIDARGQVVAPGFIDMLGQSE